MQKQSLLLAASLAALLVSGAADAAGKAVMKAYRYKNANGQLVIESSIPPEFASKGYQVINAANGQVLEDVPPSANLGMSAEEIRAKAQMNAELSARDRDLRKLYSSPQDAERQRDRQIEAIKLKVDFAKGQLSQLNNKRKAELEQAAAQERKGVPVSKEAKASLDRINTQIAAQEQQVKSLEGDMQKVHDDFDPVIERLKVLYPNKVAPAAPAAPASAPTAPATPAAPMH